MRLGHRLLTGGVSKSAALVISAGLSLVTMPILLRCLGARQYGIWILSGIFVTYFSLTDMGMNAAISQFFSSAYGRKDFDRMSEVISTSIAIFIIPFILTLCLTAITSASSSYWFSLPEESETFSIVILLLGVIIAFQLPTKIAGGILYTLVRHDVISIGTITEALVRVGFVLYLATHGYGLKSLAIVTMTTNLLENFWQIFNARRLCPGVVISKAHVSKSCAKEMFRYTSVSFVSSMTSGLRLQTLPMLVTRLVSVEAVVIFSIAQRFLSYCSQLARSVSDMLTSVFSQLHSSGNHSAVFEMLLITTSLGTLTAGYISLCIVLYSKAFIQSWVGIDYLEAATIIYIIGFPICIEIIMYPSKELFYGINKLRGMAYLHCTELVLVLLFSSVLGYYFGLLGIAWGFALGVVPMELIVVPTLIHNHFHRWDQIRTILGILFKWSFSGVLLYMLIHPYVNPSFQSLILWNAIQLIISLPLLYITLPKQIRQRLYFMLVSKPEYNFSRG